MSLPSPARDSQRGATLIVALVVVIIVGLLSTSVSHEFLTLARRVENRLEAGQVESYLIGAESVARRVLLDDLQLSPEVDYGTDVWAQRLEISLPEGTLRACLADLGGKLDLNALGTRESEGLSSEQRRFIRLLQVLELDTPLDLTAAVMLANAVFDWVDPDDDVRIPGGAEDLYYYQQEPPGKAANRAFFSVSELRLIRGMNEEIYRALTPHVTVWGNGFLNINSVDSHLTRALTGVDAGMDDPAPPVVMRTLNAASEPGPITVEAARMLLESRNSMNGYDDPEALAGRLDGLPLELEGLAAGSEYFSLLAEMTAGERRYQMQTDLHRFRDNLGIPRVSVLSRSMLTDKLAMDEFCVN